MKSFDLDDILNMEKYYRVSLINKISGFKSANLIATVSEDGISNLAVFNSVVHIGANPPYLGFIMRPMTVERHSYTNIKNQKYFTVNAITESIHKKAHQTSAKYPQTVNEFDAVGLTEQKFKNFPIPFVKESPIKIGLSFQEEQLIKVNQTRLIIGKIEQLIIPDNTVDGQGDIDLASLEAVAIGGLDSYYSCERLAKHPFARVD